MVSNFSPRYQCLSMRSILSSDRFPILTVKCISDLTAHIRLLDPTLESTDRLNPMDLTNFRHRFLHIQYVCVHIYVERN